MLCSSTLLYQTLRDTVGRRGTPSEVRLSTRDQSRGRYDCQRVWHNHGRYGERDKA